MNNLDAQIHKYLSMVKRELKPYSFAFKKKALQKLSDDLLSFAELTPNAGFEQICEQFGHPNEFADNLLETVDADELKIGTHKKKILTQMIIVLLVLLLIFCAFNLYKTLNSKVTHTTETTIVYVNE